MGEDDRMVAIARDAGVGDENELTNLVFFARHPEMNRRKIEAHETALAKEWVSLRDSAVQAALSASGTG